MVAPIILSSGSAIEAMLSRVDWPYTKLFVEYEPGVSAFRGAILERLETDASLLMFDTNPTLIDLLRRNITGSRSFAIHGSPAGVEGIKQAFDWRNVEPCGLFRA